MAPKNLLRHKECKSNLSEFYDVQGHPDFDKQGTRFKRLIKDIRRLVLCSGKLCPFPYDLIQRVLKRYPNAEVVWCQEEPMNMAPYSYIAPRLATAMKALDRGTIDGVKYVGRAPAAATATGFYSMHTREQSELVQKALQQEPVPNPALC
ncbi:2-oxoglutarate dehydrogenase, mitochondrial-like protein [Tanacetum coccineum]